MTSPVPDTDIGLPQIIARHATARQIIAGFADAMPARPEIWHLRAALDDIPALAAGLATLTAELKETRLDLANLLAAARATLAADTDGEADPLWYIRDELDAHPSPSQPHGRTG